jgi:phosphatidyl-myo-inositol dimannoside synthase
MTRDLPAWRKVLVLAPSLKSVGGVQTYTTVLLQALRDVLGDEHVRCVEIPEDAVQRGDGVSSLRTSAKLRFAISAFAAALSWSPDLVVCAHIGIAPLARYVHKVVRVPYWVILYGIDVWGDLSPAKRVALKSAARLVAITRFTLDATINRHSLGNPSAVILPPTLAKQSLARPRANNATNALRPPVVLTVGRIAASERYKGHEVMLEAWPAVLRSVPDAEYWIVGGGDDREHLELRASELGISGSVRFLGPVSSEKLALCYDRCWLFAMPARTELDGPVPRGEGFGIVYLEAMAFGKPVVGPQFGAPAEFIRSREHGLLVDPGDPAAVAAAIVELLSDPARAHGMGMAAKQWVSSEFSFESFCARLREALGK